VKFINTQSGNYRKLKTDCVNIDFATKLLPSDVEPASAKPTASHTTHRSYQSPHSHNESEIRKIMEKKEKQQMKKEQMGRERIHGK